MSGNTWFKVAFGCGTVLTALAWAVLGFADHTSPPAQSLPALPPPAPSAIVTLPPVTTNVTITPGLPGMPPPAAGAVVPRRPDLTRALVLEDGARAFVLKAKASGDPLARRYANEILGGCQSAIVTLDATRKAQPDIESVSVEQYQAASAALALLQRRCGQFTPDELRDTDSGPDLSTKEGRVVAGLFALGRQPHADPVAARNAVLAAAVDSADPLLWARWGVPLLVRAGPQGSHLYLDGAAISIKAHPETIAALSLVPCLLGMDCSGKTSELALQCFAGLGCFDSLFDQVRAHDGQGDPARYAAILAQANQIVRAIRERRVSALSP